MFASPYNKRENTKVWNEQWETPFDQTATISAFTSVNEAQHTFYLFTIHLW